MNVYFVQVPYTEVGSNKNERRLFANIEVEAESEDDAAEQALKEFERLASLGDAADKHRVVENKVTVRKAEEAPQVKLRITLVPMSGGVTCLRLSGILDATTVPEFNRELQRDALSGGKIFIFDMSNVQYINSTALGLLVGVSDLMEVRLAHVPERVLRVMKMVGLHRVFKIFSSVEEAAGA